MGVYRRAEELSGHGETVALVTVTHVTGSAPRDAGTVMLVRENGEIEGTIGGGTVEHLAIEAAQEAIATGTPASHEFELRPGGNTGMVCDGSMNVFINVIAQSKRLLMVGGGHIAVPVVRIAHELGYEVTVVEKREEFSTDERFPSATIVREDIETALEEYTFTGETAVVIATRSSTFDRLAAKPALESDAFYVGCVSSQSKAAHICDGLRQDGLTDADIDRFRAPIGIDVGADAPAEIAISILAEVEAVRSGGSGTPHSGIPLGADPDTVEEEAPPAGRHDE